MELYGKPCRVRGTFVNLRGADQPSLYSRWSTAAFQIVHIDSKLASILDYGVAQCKYTTMRLVKKDKPNTHPRTWILCPVAHVWPP
jgi:hypothetical protein